MNTTTRQTKVKEFLWKDISLSIEPGKKGVKKCLLDNVLGSLKPGEIMALMGPSGSGKTTLLNILAHRKVPTHGSLDGEVLINNNPTTRSLIKEVSAYVEQEDSLIGSLTVKETVDFNARLAGIPKAYRRELVEETIRSLGLKEQSGLQVGTPLQKGISGGQKRRLSIASQMVSKPSILFLDEPTSGLDSVASKEVISMIKRVAEEENMIVICSIHQPSTSVFQLFDKVTFLSKGKMVYAGTVNDVVDYFSSAGYSIPVHYNPSEYILDLINIDFSTGNEGCQDNEDNQKELVLNDLFEKWDNRRPSLTSEAKEDELEEKQDGSGIAEEETYVRPCIRFKNYFLKECNRINILLKRSLIKSRRDLLAYYVRIVMYLGLAIMMGTVWLRLDDGQDNIQPFMNALFFSGAFMSFMSVAYIPAFLEDYSSYVKDNANGLYGPFAFLTSNFIIGLPFLFAISLIFSIVTYFMCNFRHSAIGFWYYVMWLFLDLVAAESMTIFMCSVFPNFVVSLSLTAFANGLWMSVGGFLVSQKVLNVFWYYTFYWIDYQRYVFQGMMFNEFSERVYRCNSECYCMYNSPLASQCKIAGNAVLQNLGYGEYKKGLWAGILIVLIFVYRFGSYILLKLRS